MYNAFYYAACVMIFAGTLIGFALGVVATFAWFIKWGVEKNLWKVEDWK